MSDATERWGRVLDDLQDQAQTALASLEAGELVEVAPWTPPTDLGPVPGVLEQRARDVLELLEHVQREGARRARELRGEVGEVGTRRDALAAYAQA